MEEINLFLAHAVELECESARRYEELAESMRVDGNKAVEKFFRKMATFSRKHLADAIARGGFRRLPVLEPHEYNWPDGVSPEKFGWVGVDAMMDVHLALELALDSERRGQAFYADFASASADPDVKAMAHEFATEEAEHVAELEKWIDRYAVQEDRSYLSTANRKPEA